VTSDQRSPRKRQLKAGTIGFNGGGGIDSIVKNLSGTGALLQVESVIGIPDQFTLFIETEKFKRDCQVVWRQPTRLEIRFV